MEYLYDFSPLSIATLVIRANAASGEGNEFLIFNVLQQILLKRFIQLVE